MYSMADGDMPPSIRKASGGPKAQFILRREGRAIWNNAPKAAGKKENTAC